MVGDVVNPSRESIFRLGLGEQLPFLRPTAGRLRFGVLAAGRLAERCAEQLHKGSAVYLEGRLQSRNYRLSDGRPRSVIEIRADQVQFLEKDTGPEESEAPHEGHGPSSRPEEGELFPGLEDEEGSGSAGSN